MSERQNIEKPIGQKQIVRIELEYENYLSFPVRVAIYVYIIG